MSASEKTHFEKVADYVVSDDDSELGKLKAERDYALHCLEREIAIAHQAQTRIEALELALREADTACFKLCTNHGFATGHGDTVVAMIEEIDAQISARAALDKDAGK